VVGVNSIAERANAYRGEVFSTENNLREDRDGYGFYYLAEGTLDSAASVIWIIVMNPQYAPSH